MKNLELCGQNVRVNEEDMVCLTDMWKASGSKAAKEPRKFLKLKDTTEYVNELNRQNLGGLKIIKGRHNSGTWACKYIAYKYASWIDKVFEVGAYKVLDSYFAGHMVRKPGWQDLHDYVVDERYSKKLGTFHDKGLAQRKAEKSLLKERHRQLLMEFQLALELEDLI